MSRSIHPVLSTTASARSLRLAQRAEDRVHHLMTTTASSTAGMRTPFQRNMPTFTPAVLHRSSSTPHLVPQAVPM